ncbi:unnamed protein product [Urochloa decumbens]|uniref:Bet v I/Major latex protein domain-containing protein n=1 Tax=Urochloa decumbens TaxID=240449 RepID=A0ABC8YC99_9POAL
MEGSLRHVFETDLPAADVWEVYGSLRLGQLIPELLPHVAQRIDHLEGDGGVGTALLVHFAPGAPGPRTHKEVFTKVDNENYIKEATIVEGGFLHLGFKKFMVGFKIIAKGEKASLICSTIEYEVDDEHKSNASFVSTGVVAAMAEAMTKYIKEQKNSKQAEV